MARSILVLALAACSSSSRLDVFLQTDLQLGREFDQIELSWSREGMEIGTSTLRSFVADYPAGARLAEVDVDDGPVELRAELQSGGSLVASRRVLVDVRGATAATIVITRDCAGVACPSGDDPRATECLGGRCVSPQCRPEVVDSCDEPSACECPAAPACVEQQCVAGACLSSLNDGACEGRCDLELGCVNESADAGVDAAPPPLDAAPKDTGVNELCNNTNGMSSCLSCCFTCIGDCELSCGGECTLHCPAGSSCTVRCDASATMCRLEGQGCDISKQPGEGAVLLALTATTFCTSTPQ